MNAIFGKVKVLCIYDAVSIADCNLLPFSMYLLFYYVVYLQGNKMKQSYLSCAKGVFNLCDGPLLHLPKFRHVLYRYYVGGSKFEF